MENILTEKEYLFEHHHPGIFMHVLVTPSSSIHSIKYPPTIGDQVCEHKAIKGLNNEIYLAHSTQQYGNYEFVWKRKEMSFLMIIRAAPWISYDWAMNLLQKMQISGETL